MKFLRQPFWVLFVLGTTYAMFIPDFVGCGCAWLTIHVRVVDAATGQAIPAASVPLVSERRKTEERPLLPPTVLTARTDSGGHATVKDMFGAGSDRAGTSINVDASTVLGDIRKTLGRSRASCESHAQSPPRFQLADGR